MVQTSASLHPLSPSGNINCNPLGDSFDVGAGAALGERRCPLRSGTAVIDRRYSWRLPDKLYKPPSFPSRLSALLRSEAVRAWFRLTGAMRRSKLFWVLTALLVGTVSVLPAQDDLGPLDDASSQRLESKSISDFESSPFAVVEKMLELAQVRPNERVYDLGSGDGRIVIMAAQKFAARPVGIELDPRRCRLSREKIQRLGLRHQVTIIEGDVLEQDLSDADVVTIYMPPSAIPKLRSHLERFLHHGMRIVTSINEVPGWKPTLSTIALGEDKKAYKLTLYVISRPGDWISFSKFGRAP